MFNTEKYLLALVMGFSFMSTSIVAQEESSDVEEVVVTGSRIATSEFTGAQPVIVLDQEVIARSAELTISDVLREMPINIAGSNYERSGSSAGGTSEISLRGLGASRTLVLIDGRRVPAHPKTGGESANLNLLPTAAIERVEVLADGASAVYGSDAIGGVVNIITKKDFNGVTISATTSMPDLDGGEEESFSIVGGFSNDDSRVLWSYEHQQRDIIYMTDRSYTGGRAPTDGDLGNWF
jgi:iron complex outermembrane receptor protein